MTAPAAGTLRHRDVVATIDAIRHAVAAERGDDPAPVISGAGTLTMLTHQVGRDYTRGYDVLPNMELGHVTAVALGLATADPRCVIAVEGDGSALAGQSALTTVGTTRPPNLVVVLVDDQLYHSFGTDPGHATATARGANLALIAQGGGVPTEKVLDVDEPEQFAAALRTGLTEPGPWVLVCHVTPHPDDRVAPASVDPDIIDGATLFRRTLAARGYGRRHRSPAP